MASSSSKNSWNYDVFLSFRGPDTRNTFTGHLFQALHDKGINVFIDNDLKRGEVITSQLLKVIEQSRISIVVLSKKYASSSFCLDELVKILECGESKRQSIVPIFYHVDPTDVEEQTRTFGQEFAKLETQLNIPNLTTWPMNKRRIDNEKATENNEKVLLKWRLALTEVARLSGWHLQNGDREATTIQSIVKSVLKQLNHTQMHVAEHPIGLTPRINHILEELNMESNDVRMLGLHGMGGIGKTTTAKVLYNTSIAQFQFDGSCFLLNVREESKKIGIAQLQETILSDILGDKICLSGNFDKGIELIKARLCGKKVLIAIDDVDCSDQLKKLAGGLEWFGAGSRIIITTRDLYLLKEHGVTGVHEVKKLEDAEAMELFSWHAFKEAKPSEDYMELSRLVVGYAKGFPLALKVLGSSLYGRKVLEWNDELEKLKRCPNKKITDVLKISYDGLDCEEKTIFLDIAVFLKGMKKDVVIKFLKACGLSAYGDVRKLVEKSLVSDSGLSLEMHDLLVEMGTQIAQEESSRLCIQKRKKILMFLENKRACNVEILVLDFDDEEEEIALNFLESLTKLRILVIRNENFTKMPKKLPNSIRWLEWNNCSISPQVFPNGLIVLKVHRRSINNSLSKVERFMNLTRMNFYNCMSLKKTVDFSAIPNLQVLNLKGCDNLEKIKSIGNKLERLDLWGCSSFTSLPNLVENQRLVDINLCKCSKLEKLPNLPKSLEGLHLAYSGIKEIPWFIRDLVNLGTIGATGCKNLISVSNNIYNLPHLETMFLNNCPNLLNLPKAESSMFSLNFLDLSGNKFVSLPTNIFKFSQILALDLENCEWLVEIPELPRRLHSLRAGNCKSLVRFSQSQFEHFEGDFINCNKLAAENETENWREMDENEEQVNSMRYQIILPGNEIPELYRNVMECEGEEVSFKLPPSVSKHNLIGIAWCAVFQPNFGRPSCDLDLQFRMGPFHVSSFWVTTPPESEHMWFGFTKNVPPFELLQGEGVFCNFYCTYKKDKVAWKRCGVQWI